VASYTQMNALADTFSGEDFEILGFPCTNFGKLEPGDGYDEITNGVKYVRPGGGFVGNLTYYEKTDVNGDNQHPIYTFLKTYCPYTDTSYRTGDLFYTPQRVGDIWWNFEKFLIGRDGKPYTRYHPTTTDPLDLEDDIKYLLSQPDPTAKI